MKRPAVKPILCIGRLEKGHGPRLRDKTGCRRQGAGARNLFELAKIQDAFIDEQSRAYTNKSRYAGPWAASLRKQLQADLAFAEKCVDDYLAMLERTTAGGGANVIEGEKILDVLVLAISVLNSVNDLLDEMFALGNYRFVRGA